MRPILMLTPSLPYPPQQGAALRNWGLLHGLAQHFPVWLLSYGQTPVDPVLQAVCTKLVVCPAPQPRASQRLRALLTTRQPDLLLRGDSLVFAQQLRQWLQMQPFLAVQIEGLELTGYLPLIQQCQPDLPIVFDAHNAEATIQQRALATDWRQPRRWLAAAYSAFQVPRLQRLEQLTCQTAQRVLCVSTTDQQLLAAHQLSLPPLVVPNGLNFADYQPPSAPPPTPPRLVFTGKLDYRPNVDAVLWFAESILPHIRAQQPTVEFWVVGQRPSPAIRALQGKNGVHVTGAVPDIQPYVAGASVFVAPLRMGGGTRLKLLEAFALERAVVATPVGAEGFAVTDGEQLLLAEHATDFAAAVLRVLADPSLQRHLGQRARQFGAQYYDWQAILPALWQCYRQLAIDQKLEPVG